MSTANEHPESSDAKDAQTLSPSQRKVAHPTNNLVLVDDASLKQLHARENIVDYVKIVWRRRHFIWAETKSKSLASGNGTYLGMAWVVLEPLFQVAVYAIVFGLILKISRGMDNFIGFLMIGVIFFGFFTGGITSGGNLIQRSRSLISSFNFPKVSLVVSLVLRQFVDHIVPALIAVLGALAFQWGSGVSFSILGIIPIYILAHIFAFGCVCIGARMSAFFPDVTKILKLVNRALFFTSGVFFTIERFETHPLLLRFVEANPIYQFLNAARTCVLDGVLPSTETWTYISVWSFAVAIIGLLYFWQAEERYIAIR